MGIAVYPVYALLKRRQTPERRKGGDVFDSCVRHRPPLAPNFNVEAKAVHQAPKKEEKKKKSSSTLKLGGEGGNGSGLISYFLFRLPSSSTLQSVGRKKSSSTLKFGGCGGKRPAGGNDQGLISDFLFSIYIFVNQMTSI